MAGEELYVVASRDGTAYAQTIGADGTQIKGWTGCQRCAKRMNRAVAHRVAHANGMEHYVIRIRPKEPV